MNRVPFQGIVLERESQISSSVGPISAVWSSRTLVMTPMSARTIRCCETAWSAGSTAIHSITRIWAPSRTARWRTRTCSLMLARPRRTRGRAVPSTPITIGTVPVVLQNTFPPPARRPPSIIRVTVDFPRMPFT